MKTVKKLFGLFVTVIAVTSITGCTPYDTPEFKEISPSQTAFLVPLEGKTSNQEAFQSEEFLAKHQVAVKRVQIPHRWVQKGRAYWSGEYLPTMRLIVVERKPVAREWTSTADSGTSAQNQAFQAASRDSVGFSIGMSCTAQIDEANAAKFLYRYNSKPLEEVIDQEFRTRAETKFVEFSALQDIATLRTTKGKLMQAVMADIEPYFLSRGITITSFGMKGEMQYNDEAIQTAINAKFTAAEELKAARDQNKRIQLQAAALRSKGAKEAQERQWAHEERMEFIAAMREGKAAMPQTLVIGSGAGNFMIPLGNK